MEEFTFGNKLEPCVKVRVGSGAGAGVGERKEVSL